MKCTNFTMRAANKFGSLFIALIFLALSAPASMAMDQQAAIDLITKTADRICNEIKNHGSSADSKVSASIAAEVNGLLKKLANLGFSASGNIDFYKWQGFLQKDLPEVWRENVECKSHVFDKLLDRLIPSSSKDSSLPVAFTLVSGETEPFEGYSFVHKPKLPSSFSPGIILPFGGRVRLLLQARRSDDVVEIGKVKLIVRAVKEKHSDEFAYRLDPTKQPGFGAAQPRRFNVRLFGDRQAQVFYVNAKQKALPLRPNNILDGTNFSLLRLDSSSGLQETLDLNIVAADPGIYELRFVAHASTEGKEYDLQAGPLYIARSQ